MSTGFFTPAIPSVAPDYEDEWPDGWPRHRGDGRPKIRLADDPTRMTFYSRPSGFGDKIESSFLLDRYVLAAVNRFPDLLDAITAAMNSGNSIAHPEWSDDPKIKDALNLVRVDALRRMGAEAKATSGTAVHKLWERRLAGHDLAFVGPRLMRAVDLYTDMMSRFVVHAIEQRVICDAWGTAGTTDVVVSPREPMTAPDGSVITPDEVLIGDGKSGAHIDELGKVARAIQFACYAHSVPYQHVDDGAAAAGKNGRLLWGSAELGLIPPPSREWALAFHVPLESLDDTALWWVDLRKGTLLAELASGIRAARKMNGLFLPAELPDVVAEPVEPDEQYPDVSGGGVPHLPVEPPARATPDTPLDTAGLLTLLRTAESYEALVALWDSHGESVLWTDGCTTVAQDLAGALQLAGVGA